MTSGSGRGEDGGGGGGGVVGSGGGTEVRGVFGVDGEL